MLDNTLTMVYNVYQMIHFREVINIKEYIKKTFIFSGIANNSADALLENLDFRVTKYARTDTIYSPSSYSAEVGFVLSGECEIRQRTAEGGKVILNTRGEGDSFGILTVFREELFPTEVYAKRKCEILFISKRALISLIEASSVVALNVIRFLAERVGFLNERLEAASLGSVDKKLASYLLHESAAVRSDTLALNFKRCAETICAGRASVYRSIETLKSHGYIEAENKIIKIINRKNLEEFLK